MRPPKKILVIMLRRIGDVLLTIPAARALSRLHPGAQVDILVEPPCHELLRGAPGLSRVLVYGRGTTGAGERGDSPTESLLPNYIYWMRLVRRERYDMVVDFMGNPRTAVLTRVSGAPLRAGPGHVSHRWAYSHLMRQPGHTCYSALEKIRMLRSLGLKPDESEPIPCLSPDAPDLVFAEKNLPAGEAAWIALMPASRRETRRWPAEHYAALGRKLVESHAVRPLVLWGPGERALAERIAAGIGPSALLSPRTRTLRELAGLLSRCLMAISNCNGPRHIATALGVPTLAIHGSSDPAAWNPPADPLFPYIRKEGLDCIGCRSNRCVHALECLRGLSPDAVFAAAERLLARSLERSS